MADILGAISKMLVEETDFNSAVSEASMQKMGGNVNALIDSFNLDRFLTSGSFTSPANLLINYAFLWGAGGGGGGAGGSGGVDGSTGPLPSFDTRGGGGGAGAVMSFRVIPISAATVYAITVGGGGPAGAGGVFPGTRIGSPGGTGISTTFASLATFFGGLGGNGGSSLVYPSGGYPRAGGCSGGGDGNDVTRKPDLAESSVFASGGAKGVNGSAGGGGASLGNGAAGGTTGVVGSSAAANSAAGGGGGGRSAVGTSGHAGGAGGSGFLYILTFGF